MANDQHRHQVVSGLLAVHLDAMLRAARTHDGKPLTDGEVMSAIGIMIAGHVPKPENVNNWVRAIELSATLAYAQKGKTP